MILITGASGLLGCSLIALAREQGRDVCGIYHRHAICVPGVPAFAADLRDEATTAKILSELKPSAVIHCAAATDVDWCEEHPEEAYVMNVAASAQIAKITSRMNARLLHVSTDSVFDGVRGGYTENEQTAPLNIYARTKLSAEKEVLDHHPSAAIARVNLYGWNLLKKSSLPEWILQELTHERIVPGFVDVVFCPILANDLAEILLAMLDRNLTGIYHVTGSEPIDKCSFARRVAELFDLDPEQVVPTRLDEARLKAARPRNTSLNTDKICAAMGRSMPTVDAGLQRFARLREDRYLEKFTCHLAGALE
jgi:dTDP-4-dehydrorhamnose reductase